MSDRTPSADGLKAWEDLTKHAKTTIFDNSRFTDDPSLMKPATYTCCDCPVVLTCRSRYDMYNTNGDCLESK